jgi:ribosome biogenesis GTPase / thiamine phosphate phosphatase
MAAVESHASTGRTVVLIGTSGAGKSTVANALIGADVLRIGATRADGKGRHTTVARELIPLRAGGVLIDTPGLRGVGLLDLEGLQMAFPEVEALAVHCRFGDCLHVSEPGCAVVAAVEAGSLPARRLESWHKLRKEAEQIAARSDARLRADELRRWKRSPRRSRYARPG